MKHDDFQPNTPGELVPIVFRESSGVGPPREINGVAFVPHHLPPALDAERLRGRLFDVLSRAQANLLRLEGAIDALPGKSVLLSAMRIREAQASSRIENTIASIRDIALAGADEQRSAHDPIEVLRNRWAIEWGLRSKYPICGSLVREMHRQLIHDPEHTPGSYRTRPVCIGDKGLGFRAARFVPPPSDRIEDAMRDWERYCNPGTLGTPDRPRLPYYAELAIAHYQFETIHPFSDWNGRLGRALVTLAPVKDGELRHPVCNLSEWVQSNRQAYYDHLLRVSTHADWESWIAFICTAIAEQAAADLQRAQRVAALYQKYESLITQRRGSILRRKLLDHLFDRQAVTITQAAKVLGVSYPAAQRHLDTFERAGIVTPIKGRTYARVYVAENVIRAIRGKGED